jgi:acetyl-CoA decarbonylase/synthase complex subunit gamma
MASKGSDILKKLPNKKGCKECGFPTCFAFAMKLASGGTTIDKCPYISTETQKEIEESLAPPIKLVTIGADDNALKIGNEEALFRHEHSFLNQPGIALLISDTEEESSIENKIHKINNLTFNWIGMNLKADLLALHYESGDKLKYKALVKKVHQMMDIGLILISEDMEVLFSARDMCADRKPLLYPITKDNIAKAIPEIKVKPTPVGIRGNSIDELVRLSTELKDSQIEDIILAPVSRNMREAVRDQTLIRRSALKHHFRPLGYPTMAFPCFMAGNNLTEILLASVYITKYSGIIVLSDLDRYSLFPLLVHRLNIYTDPQMPFSVEEKIYKIGEPDKNSPILIASNWALSYLLLSQAIEDIEIPTFLCVKDVKQADVLCWCHHCLRSVQPEKLDINETAQFIRKCGIENMVENRKLVIPGRASRFEAELEEALPDWEIIIGPQEADGIISFLPGYAKELRR